MARSILLILVSMLFLAACQSSEDYNDMAINLQFDSIEEAETQMIITVRDAQNDPVEDATITMQANDIITETTQNASGVYRLVVNAAVEDDWIISITATRPNGGTQTREFEADSVVSFAACAPVTDENDEAECAVELPTASPLALPGLGGN